MNDVAKSYTVDCFCGVSHELPQDTNTKLTCICGRSINGIFGVEGQRQMNNQNKLLLDTIRIGRLALFTTEELADEVARRVRES